MLETKFLLSIFSVSMAATKLTSSKLYKTVFLEMLNTLASIEMEIDEKNRVKHEKSVNAFCSQNKTYLPGQSAR